MTYKEQYFSAYFYKNLSSLLTDGSNINNESPKLREQKYSFVNFGGRFSNFITFTKRTTEEN